MQFASLLCMEYSCLTVHGFVHVDGSSIVTTYSSVFGPVRVQRSTKWRFSRDPMKSALGLKLVTSTTSVSPSHRPRESPKRCRMELGRCVLPLTGITRGHPWPCPTSQKIDKASRDCTIRRKPVKSRQ